MKPKQIKGVPEQQSGGFHDTESQKQFDPALIALKFELLKDRFFDVNRWESYCGKGFAAFKIYDSSGNEAQRMPQIGDCMRIDIPGPGEKEARGYDWVEITDMCFEEDNSTESIVMTCRPSRDPKNSKKDHIAHFYSSKSTSTFIISRTPTHLKAAVYGRNESPNFNAGFADIVRNLMVATGGIMGISKIQWKRLSDGFLDFE
ncbi:hypothetical protein SAMN05444360_111102 [Chryseobacterium carnipullorum]|uniref:hypothetical protein n=1 Tax=Chryseobacterium carnipullorum TaxID=1124835 RepID=UPI000911C4A6|nr:hypothetical protein [Chryseobacterium carnipullorum]SHM39286.1 hypothetical protein SAMN05444360_111102 [Chryseobacterium carnipullorum]